jgi:protein-S-isoprenylcysteine O-methyltransferase Ste14
MSIRTSPYYPLAVVVVVFSPLLFLGAGRIRWFAGWGYVLLFALVNAACLAWVHARNPRVLERRRTAIKENTKSWDKWWLAAYRTMYVGSLVVGSIENGRFAGGTLPMWLWATGAATFTVGTCVFYWGMAHNQFFEKSVRIQEDHGHQVVDSGPYGIVRHPGYVGCILSFAVATPLLFASWWSALPAAMTTLLYLVRTAAEDATLRRELPGYADFAQRVRYRLVPGLW